MTNAARSTDGGYAQEADFAKIGGLLLYGTYAEIWTRGAASLKWYLEKIAASSQTVSVVLL